MTDAEIAWVAGLLEGEGSFVTYHRERPAGSGVWYWSWLIQCNMTDPDVISELARVAGMGVVRKRARENPTWQPIHCWCVTRRADAKQLIEAIYPWMGERRRARIDEILAEMVAYPQRQTKPQRLRHR